MLLVFTANFAQVFDFGVETIIHGFLFDFYPFFIGVYDNLIERGPTMWRFKTQYIGPDKLFELVFILYWVHFDLCEP